MPQLHDLRSSLGAVPVERDVVRVQGPEAVDFLQGQLSQDVSGLGEGASAWALLLQPSGKVDAWLRATRLGDDEVLLDVDGGSGDQVAARLRRFKLRTKADIDLAGWKGLAVRGPGSDAVPAPTGALALPARWPGVEGIDLIAPDPLGNVQLPLAEPHDLDALRIECGVPAMGAELTQATIPAEAGAWLIEASVSFTKGCYTGQELVARVDSRGGNVPRPVRGLIVDGEPVAIGSEVAAGGSPVGTVTSTGRSAALGAIALATVARSVPLGGEVQVSYEGRSTAARVAELPLR